MFRATWKVGPSANLLAETWMQATQEALRLSAESTNRDELIRIEWVEK